MFVFSTARGCALEPWAKTAENRTYSRHASHFLILSLSIRESDPRADPIPIFLPHFTAL